MTTKNDCLFLKDKQKSIMNNISNNVDKNGGQHLNLNLNQKHKYPILIPVQSYSKTNKDKHCATFKITDSTVSENYKRNATLKLWNKSSDFCSNSLILNVKTGEKAEKKLKKGNSFTKNSNSTLSLYIAAFENSVESVVTFDTIKQWENKKESFIDSTFFTQNPFEFPRQENDKVTEPEMFQFSASQQLLSPNEPTKNGHPNVFVLQQQHQRAANHTVQQQQFSPQILQHQPLHSIDGMQRLPLQSMPKVNKVSMNRTLAIIKPDAVSHPVILKMVGNIIINSGFNISRACRIRLTRNQAEQLYSVHLGKFFYDRLIAFMTSGPVLAMELQCDDKNDVIKEWRNLLGPSKLYANFLKYSSTSLESKPLRIRFATSDTRNLAHGSDSPEEVLREIAVFEPLFKIVNDPHKLFELPNELKATTD